jgi:hypothetical protein
MAGIGFQASAAGRRTLHISVTVAIVITLLWFGLLLGERSGSSPVRHLGSSPAHQPAHATNAPGGRSTLLKATAFAATISGGGGHSQITDTGAKAEVLCQEFNAGTATTVSQVVYDTNNAAAISKILTPGQFFYWVTVNATSAGTQNFTITETTTYAPTTGTPYFLLGSGTSAYDANCNPLGTTTSGGTASNPSVTVTFTAPAPGPYEIGVKFGTHSVIGSSPASTTSGFSYNYTFSTTGVTGSTQGLQLTHT